MKLFYPTEQFTSRLVYSVFDMSNKTLSEFLHFFIFGTIKMLGLLNLIVFVVVIIRTYFPIETILSFMMAVSALYLLELLILSQKMKARLILTFSRTWDFIYGLFVQCSTISFNADYYSCSR